jgi:hypothetical protein
MSLSLNDSVAGLVLFMQKVTGFPIKTREQAVIENKFRIFWKFCREEDGTRQLYVGFVRANPEEIGQLATEWECLSGKKRGEKW